MAFNHIYGHEKQISILRNAITRSRVPHAYLFYGMEGIGKRATAEVFAKALNCRDASADACDQCPSCLKMDHGNHPDFRVLEAEGQFIRIREIRDLQAQLVYSPFEGGKRIFLIDDADKMNRESANALLKTLEEPSPSNILILITSRPHLLAPTILSRCHHLRFNPLQTDKIALFLQNRLSLDTEASELLAASAGGSVGKAMAMGRSDYLDLRDEMIRKFAGIHAEDPFRVITFVGDMGKDKSDTMKKLDILKACYRDILVYKETGDTALIINRDRRDIIRDIAGRLSGRTLLHRIKAVEKTSRAVEQNANRQLALEVMALELAGVL